MPAGRPTRYKPEFCEHARKLCLIGLIDEEIAASIGVTVSTFNRWKIYHPEFSEALKNGRENADRQVADRLFHRACGYDKPWEKVTVEAGGGGTTKRITQTGADHIPPDTAAAFIWLKNRQPRYWRDRKELTGAEGQPLVPPTPATDSLEIAKKVAFLLNNAEETTA